MAKSKGQAMAHGHSHGSFGHGGHHKKDAVYNHSHSMQGSPDIGGEHMHETGTAGSIGGE